MDSKVLEDLIRTVEAWPVRPGDVVPAGEPEVSAFEEEHGLRFPLDYRWFLLNHAGADMEGYGQVFVPRSRQGTLVAGDPTEFYQTVAARWIPQEMERHRVWQFDLVDPGVDSPWWAKQIPIHPYRHDKLYCLDFHYDADAPPVIKIDYGDVESDFYHPPVHGGWATYVAPSFAEMVVNQMRTFRHDYPDVLPSDVDLTPYKHADAAGEWREAFRKYLGQFHELAD